MNLLERIFVSIWETALQMAPWLLFGFLAAGILSLLVSPENVCRFLGRAAGKRAIALAVAVGVPLPLCSCGVLPVAASLKRSGAGKGAVAAFLISTPQTGIDSFFATGSLLGWCFALLRPLVAAITGYFGGVAIQALDQSVEVPLAQITPSEQKPRSLFGKLWAVLNYGYGKLLHGVASALLIGLLLSALIMVFVPDSFFEESILGNDWVAFPVMLLIGMPMYVCSTASIPVALSLMAKGISPGAALIFLIVGPALNGASLTMLLQILGKKCLAAYLLIIAGASIIAGALLNWLEAQWDILPNYVVRNRCCAESCVSDAWVQITCAVILFALLAWHLVIGRILQKKASVKQMTILSEAAKRITVKGMRCDHCRSLVNRLLTDYPSISAVTLSSPDTFDVVGEIPDSLADDLRKLGFELNV